MEQLRKSIQEISPLSPESEAALLADCKEWIVAKDHLLLRRHAVDNYIYFIEKGIARNYYYKNGKDITEWIAVAPDFFVSIASFFERTPSELIIQTIEPSEVIGIPYNSIMALADKYHDVERLLRKLVTYSLILSQHRMESIQFETAQQRYERLKEKHPAIIQRVPLTYIASFLGITLETLSRIRKNI